MDFQEWMAEAAKIAAAHARLSEVSKRTVRGALLALHRLMGKSPNELEVAYRTVTEPWLRREAEERKDRIGAGDYRWTPPAGADEFAWVSEVAVQIRALDWALLGPAATHQGPPSGPGDWYDPEHKAFIVPRKHGRRLSEKTKDYSRRGLLHHRILPAKIGSYEISLVWNGTMSPTPGAAANTLTMGAALFKELKLGFDEPKNALDEGRKDFIVVAATCDDPDGTIAHQIEKAIATGCFAVVWPELTVPANLRKLIADTFRDRPIEDERAAPQVVVAGTWHEKHEDEDGSIANVATVLDGCGVAKLAYQKMIPYEHKELGVERIKPGKKLPILVTDDRLVAFAICKDFAEGGLDLPYRDLDVDLFLVPSMGNEATMDGHQVTAKNVRIRYDARTFVVQQDDAPKAKAPGFVLPIPDMPTLKKPSELKQLDIWGSYEGEVPPYGTGPKAET